MAEIQALLEKIQADQAFRAEILASASMDDAVAVVNARGFSVSKADWLAHQAQQTLELSDEELEKVAGGRDYNSLSACGEWESC